MNKSKFYLPPIKIFKIPEVWTDYVFYLMTEGGKPHYHQVFWKAFQLLKFLKTDDLKGIKILEPGAGSGIVSILLTLLGAKVTLLDIDKSYLKLALRHARRFRLENKITFVQGDIKLLPHKEYFDLVWNEGVIEHFINPKPALQEMIRVTNAEGKIIVFTPSKYTFHTFIEKPLRRLFRNYPFDRWGREKSYTEKKLKKIFSSFGLKKIKTTTYGLADALLDDWIYYTFLPKYSRKNNSGLLCLFSFFNKLETKFPYLSKLGSIVGIKGEK